MGIAEDIILILIYGLVAGFIAGRMRVPMILGYIVAGIIIGPYTGGITVSDVHQIEVLAEIGVALLLFSIGLEFSFNELKEVRGIALLGAPLQLALTIAFGTGLGRMLGLAWVPSLVLGAIISVSSTMVVMKTLMNRGLMGTLSAKVMTGILIVQDLAIIPMMIIIPRLNNIGSGLEVLGLTLAKAFIFLVAVIIIGTRVIPFFLKIVARANSRELFLLTITALGLGIGYLTYLAGLSFAFGAFVTGMVLNESDYSHQALNDIIPLRDIFVLLFFTSIGMLFDPDVVTRNIRTVLLLVALVIAGKALIFSLLSRAFGYFNIIPLAVGLGLSQIGEFSFVLARIGLKEDLISRDIYSTVIATAVLTMFATPFLSMLAAPLYSLKKKMLRPEPVQTKNLPDTGLSGHIIIAGAGRVGWNTATVLHSLGLEFIMIEQDHRRYEKARDAGFPVIYGDASQEPALDAAEIREASLFIITIPVITVIREILRITRQVRDDIDIIARTDISADPAEFQDLNIHELVQPEFEASLEIIRQALLHYDFPIAAIQTYTDDIRHSHYSPLVKDTHSRNTLSNLKNACYLMETSWVSISGKSPAEGRSLRDLDVRTRTGASVTGVFRNNLFSPNPGPDFVFREGDLVSVIGNSEAVHSFEKLVSSGA